MHCFHECARSTHHFDDASYRTVFVLELHSHLVNGVRDLNVKLRICFVQRKWNPAAAIHTQHQHLVKDISIHWLLYA